MLNKKNILKLAFFQLAIWIIYHVKNSVYWYIMQPHKLQHILKFKLFQLFIPCLIISAVIILLFFVCITHYKKNYQLILGFGISVILTSFLYFVISSISFKLLWSAESKPFEFARLAKGISNHLFLFVLLNGCCYVNYYWNKKRNEIKKFAQLLAKSTKKASSNINYNSRIYIPNKYTTNYFELASIKYILADSYISNVFTVDNKKISSNLSLKQWEEKLPDKDFYRIHKSTIVNLNYICKIDKQENQTYKVFLSDSTMPLIMSRRAGIVFMKVYGSNYAGPPAVN